MKREAVIAGLASEGLALILVSAEAGSSAVVGPMPTDPVEFRKCARDLKALSAAKEHTNEERGGGRDPGVRRPGTGRGQLPARSKIFRAACLSILMFFCFGIPPTKKPTLGGVTDDQIGGYRGPEVLVGINKKGRGLSCGPSESKQQAVLRAACCVFGARCNKFSTKIVQTLKSKFLAPHS